MGWPLFPPCAVISRQVPWTIIFHPASLTASFPVRPPSMQLLPIPSFLIYIGGALSANVPSTIVANGSPTTISLESAAPLLPSVSATPYNAGLRIQCSGNSYGRNLKVNSCRNVFNYLPQNDTQRTFLPREGGGPHSVPLPMRTYSSKSVTCLAHTRVSDASDFDLGC